MPATSNDRQVHFVGSCPLDSNVDVFNRLATTFPNQLRRIPDGETGNRFFFMAWQSEVLKPWLVNRMHPGAPVVEEPTEPWTIEPINTRYDEVALESYKEFSRLREEGVIKKGIRFQVSLPTPINVLSVIVNPKYVVEVEPIYEKALTAALRKIQNVIPKEDLAIQWDMALDVLLIEFERRPEFRPPVISEHWFTPVKEGVLERALKIMKAVDEDVPMGIHLCYGDRDHKHYVDPIDLSLVVEMANTMTAELGREFAWVHMPVPKDRVDDAYFTPLNDLKVSSETELVLGVVHAWDVEGTKERMAVASNFRKNFTIATECGLGRIERGEFDSVLEVMKTVTTEIEIGHAGGKVVSNRKAIQEGEVIQKSEASAEWWSCQEGGYCS